MHSVKQFFDAIDKDHSGTIDQEEFTILCQRIDLGLNEKQVAELWGTRPEPFNSTPMAVTSISSDSPHARTPHGGASCVW